MVQWLELCKREDRSWAPQNPYKRLERVVAAWTSNAQKADTGSQSKLAAQANHIGKLQRTRGTVIRDDSQCRPQPLHVGPHTCKHAHTRACTPNTHTHKRKKKTLGVNYLHLLVLEPFLYKRNGEEFRERLPCPLWILAGHMTVFIGKEKDKS